MYKSVVNPQQFALNPAPIFRLPNGAIISDNDIEMITLHSSNNYTSLKDLMPESPPSTASPTCCRGDSWREIPIKDPLLQHAAWAYLQPMTPERRQSQDHYRCWRRLHDKFCWLLSCFNDVVLVVFQGWFPHQLKERVSIKFHLSDERENDEEGKCSFQ